MNPPIQTGLTSTSSDRRPAPSSNFVRGKSGYAPFWPGGLDSLGARPNDTDFQDGVTESKRMGAVPPGLTRGIRLSADKNRDTTSSDLFDLDGNESEAAVMVLVPWEFAVGSRIYNSLTCCPTHRKNSNCRKLCRANPQTSITYCPPRYPSHLIC